MLVITTINLEKISIHDALRKSVPIMGQKCTVLYPMSLSSNPVSISVVVGNASIDDNAQHLRLSPL